MTGLSLSNVTILIAPYVFWLLINNVSSSSSKNRMEGEVTESPVPPQTCEDQSTVEGEENLSLFYSPFFRGAHGSLKRLSNLSMSCSSYF